MKPAYLTEDGNVYENFKHVYLSDDKKYFHKDRNIVKIYELFKIKDINQLIPKEYIYKGEIFTNPQIDISNLTIEYKSKEQEIVFQIDINFNENSIQNGKPHFWRYDKELETYIEIYEEEIENYL